MEVSTIPEDVTAYSCYLLQIPPRGLLTGSPSGLQAGILTSTAPAGGIDPIRACLEAVTSTKISFLIGLQMAFP